MATFHHILVVDNQPDICEMLRTAFEDRGYRVSLAGNAADARSILARGGLDLLVSDVAMFGGSGLEVASYAESLGIPCLLMSGDDRHIAALADGRRPFLPKPFRLTTLTGMIGALLAQPMG